MLRKRGKYWNYQFEVHGVRYWGSTKETSKQKAEKFESLKKSEALEQAGNPLLRKAPTLREFSAQFLKFNEAREAAGSIDHDTARCYRNGWRMLEMTPLAGMRIDRIAASDADTITFAGGPSNANQALRTLRRILSHAVAARALRAAPRIHLRREHGREGVIEPWMEELLLEAAGEPLRSVLVAMLDAGLRPEEVLRIRKEHIDWDRSRILVPYGKSLRARRWVPLSMRLRCALRAAVGQSEWVFPSSQARGARHRSASGHRESVTKQWYAAVDAANVVAAERKLPSLPASLVLYSARHSFATRYLEDGGNIAALMKLLGHSSLSVTQKYLHAETSGAAEIVDRRNRKPVRMPDILPDTAQERPWLN